MTRVPASTWSGAMRRRCVAARSSRQRCSRRRTSIDRSAAVATSRTRRRRRGSSCARRRPCRRRRATSTRSGHARRVVDHEHVSTSTAVIGADRRARRRSRSAVGRARRCHAARATWRDLRRVRGESARHRSRDAASALEHGRHGRASDALVAASRQQRDAAAPAAPTGYWMVDRIGRVYAFNVPHHGQTSPSTPSTSSRHPTAAATGSSTPPAASSATATRATAALRPGSATSRPSRASRAHATAAATGSSTNRGRVFAFGTRGAPRRHGRRRTQRTDPRLDRRPPAGNGSSWSIRRRRVRVRRRRVPRLDGRPAPRRAGRCRSCPTATARRSRRPSHFVVDAHDVGASVAASCRIADRERRAIASRRQRHRRRAASELASRSPNQPELRRRTVRLTRANDPT